MPLSCVDCVFPVWGKGLIYVNESGQLGVPVLYIYCVIYDQNGAALVHIFIVNKRSIKISSLSFSSKAFLRLDSVKKLMKYCVAG
jgi:hypothetical protein